MMKRTAAALIVLGVLVLADSVAAKGPFAVRICGSSGCTTVKQELDGRDLGTVLLVAADSPLKAPTVGEPAPAAYYSLQLEGWPRSTEFYYVPSVRTLGAAPYWYQMFGGFVRRMETLTAGLRPWPAPRLTRVLVDGRRASDPAAYAALLGPLPDAPVPTEMGRSVRITLSAAHAGPWTDVPMSYFPAAGTLYRDSEWLRMPERLQTVVERDAGLAPPPATSSGSRPLAWIVGGGLTALVLALAVGLTLRARRAPPVNGRSARAL